MGAEKSIAIVLRVVDFSETSCVVTLMTRDFGKITALAKGARRRKNPFEAAIDVLATCRIVFLHKSSGAMDLLTEAKLERRFKSASTDLERLYAAYYIVELLRTLTEENDPHPELFDLASETIFRIDTGLEGELDRAEILLRFELETLKLLGHFPMLTQCVGCGRERKSQNRVSFGLHAGGLLCHRCRPGQQAVVNLSHQGLEYLIQMTNPKSDDTELKNDQVSEARETYEPGSCAPEQAEVRKLISQYITHLLGFPPRMQRYLKQ